MNALTMVQPDHMKRMYTYHNAMLILLTCSTHLLICMRTKRYWLSEMFIVWFPSCRSA